MSGPGPTPPSRPLPRLYAIADAVALGGDADDPGPLVEAVSRLAGAGVRWIQVRAKRFPDRLLYEAVERSLERLAHHPDVALWVDDRVDVAACLPVAGVHLGQRDQPPAAARSVLGAACWIGLSTHDRAQGLEAQGDPAVDLVAIGPVFGTRSKEAPDATVGLDGVAEARRLGEKPLVAIGGIDAERAPAVIAAGAEAVAVIGALGGLADLERQASHLLAVLR
ncbi:MAG TPA: thiamine phosphate synthase [Thermoanaerobaculia bacterium]|nr:thiamine phosphate synthase [Thermoanaerobaculia bacterium]